MEKSYDVVIVGGGVTGSSSAYFLASEPGFDGSILVVERDPTYENAPSARATGGVRQQFSTAENVRIGLFGAHFVKNIGEYLSVDGEAPDVGWKEGGYLLLASADGLAQMRENHAVQIENGADIAHYDPAALAERFAWLNVDGIAGGFHGRRNEGWLDPYGLLQAFRRKARSLGVDYVKDDAVEVVRDGARVTGVVLRDGGTVAAGAVVDAAGAHGAAAIAASAGMTLPLDTRKRCTFVFECREDVAVPTLTILPSGVAFRPEGRGFIVNVSPPEDRDPTCTDYEIDHWLFDDIIWPALAERIPAFEAIKVVRTWVCHYDFNTFDENVIIDRHPGVENFWVAAGFSGHGLQQSPAIGRALSELVTFGEYRTLDLSRLGFGRVARGERIVESNCY